MRFTAEILLNKEIFPKDKNRIILSALKNYFKSYNEKYFNELYENDPTKIKNFTFSLYMGGCKFLKEEIHIPNKKIILNYSTNNNEDGIMFFNSLLSNKGKPHFIKDNTLTINKIKIVKEKTIGDREVIYKTMSPIVVREHKGDNKTTWYHSLNTKEGQAVFMENLKYQLIDVFGEKLISDYEDIKIEQSDKNKEVKVKNYSIEVLGNLGLIKVKAQPYILDYLYKAGIGSKRSSGFGMVDIV